jgi:hypothetical protein
MDNNAKAIELLELLANAMLDRCATPVFFTANEIMLVERWLLELELGERGHGWSHP